MVAASISDVRSNAQVLRPAPAVVKKKLAHRATVDVYEAPRPHVNRQGATEPAKFNLFQSAANALVFGFFASMGNALFRDSCGCM